MNHIFLTFLFIVVQIFFHNVCANTFSQPKFVLGSFAVHAGGWVVNKHPRLLGDVNGDGYTDIVGFGNAGVYVSLGTPSGEFTEPKLVVRSFGLHAGGWTLDRHPRLLGDVNGDGCIDIVGFGNKGVYVSLGTPSGEFTGPKLVVRSFGLHAGGWVVDKHPRLLGDVNGDGYTDIVGFGNAGVYVSLRAPSGEFTGPKLVVRNFGLHAGGWVVDKHPRLLGDVNGDGCTDIVGFGNKGVYVSLGTPSGEFTEPKLVVRNFGLHAGGWVVDRHPRLLGDVNGDGCIDIVGFGNAGVYVSLGTPSGEFTGSELVLRSFGVHAGGWFVDKHPRLLGDVNGDGYTDIVGFGNKGVFVSTGTPSGGFTEPNVVIASFAVKAGGWVVDKHPRLLGDVNGDGLSDIVGFGNKGVFVSIGAPPSGFTQPSSVIGSFAVKAGGWAVDKHPRLLGDVNGDGRNDIVGFGNSGVFASLGTQSGGFTEPKLVVRSFGIHAGGWFVNKHPRLLGDVNGDGCTDIVGFGNAGVYVSLGTPSGEFTGPKLVVRNFGLHAGVWVVDKHPRLLGDVNGDGCTDIVGFGNKGVYVSLGTPSGEFTEPKLVVRNFGLHAGGWVVDRHPRLLGDVNGDGCIDIVGFGNAGVYVSLGTPSGEFTGPKLVVRSFGLHAGGWALDRHPRLLGDVNGDGCIDIVGFGNAGVYVSLGTPSGEFTGHKLVVRNFGLHAGGWVVDKHPRLLGDVNGDGCTDIVGFGNKGVFISFGTPVGEFNEPKFVLGSYAVKAGGWIVGRHPRVLGDVNGDGLTDIVGFGEKSVFVSLGLP